MADFVYMTQFREHKIDHVIETKDSEFFEIVTGITKQEFTQLCELEFINKQALNRIVREFRCQEESSLRPEEFIYNHLHFTPLNSQKSVGIDSINAEAIRVRGILQVTEKNLRPNDGEQAKAKSSKNGK